MATAEVTNRLDEINVASNRKSFNLKRIFGHSNLQKNKKEDIEVVDKQHVEKVPPTRSVPIENDSGPIVDSVDKTSNSTNCTINIEVPKQSHVAILFSFSNLFSLERKVVLIEEKIDPDDVATSPLHENDDGSREVFIWSTPTESCFQEYMSSRPEYEPAEVVEADKKSTVPSITQSDITASEDSTAGLTGEIVTSRCSDSAIECDKEKVQNPKLQSDVTDVAAKMNDSPPKKRSFRKMLLKFSNNVKRIIDKSKPSASTVKTIGDDNSVENVKEIKDEMTSTIQGENCEDAQRTSLCIIEESPSFEATCGTHGVKINSDNSNSPVQVGLADIGLPPK